MKNWKFFIIFFAFAAQIAAQNSRVVSKINSSLEYKVADYYLLSTHQNTQKILDSLILQYAHYDKVNGYDIFLLKKLKFLDYQNLTKIPEFSLDISSSKTRTEKLIPIDHFDPSQHHIDITQQDFAQSTGKNIPQIQNQSRLLKPTCSLFVHIHPIWLEYHLLNLSGCVLYPAIFLNNK